jgi:hypothetical protein
MLHYAKALVAFAFAAATLAASAITDEVITDVEWIEIAIAGLIAGGVWITANAPGYRAAKTVVAAALAGLSFLVGAILDGMTGAEWINFALAVGAVIFVWAVPNGAPAKTATPV